MAVLDTDMVRLAFKKAKGQQPRNKFRGLSL